MKNQNLNLEEFNVLELGSEELINVHGGDKFLHDVGYAIGYSYGFICDNWKTLISVM